MVKLNMILNSLLLAIFIPSIAAAGAHRHHQHTPGDVNNLTVSVFDDGNFRIDVRGTSWLSSAPVFFNADGATHIHGVRGHLKLLNGSKTHGIDAFGNYTLDSFTYQAGTRSYITTSIRSYDSQPFVYFSQFYVNGANGTKASQPSHTISGFPSFNVSDVVTPQGPLGYLAYGGIHTGDTSKSLGIFSPSQLNLTDGLEFGPLALFDGSGDSLVISPADSFMAVSNWWRGGSVSSLSYGVMGGVDTVPARFTAQFIVYYSPQGVNQAFAGWGSHLRAVYGRTDDYVKKDLTINYLGFYTDNGAYYYYHTEPHHIYQDTVIDIKLNADKEGIPYRYIQYDSWWYYKGVGNGVKTWEPNTDMFPNGLEYVYNKTGLPAVGHNRYWASDNTYARENGGQYDFILESLKAVPDDQRLWDDLLGNASLWGLVTYEQDWLMNEFQGVRALSSSVSLGDTWLTQMSSAAVKNNMTVQYCMAGSRHVMHALKTSVVTQTRASMDNRPGRDQWKIGVSSIFADAMGLAPFKDDFWSTTNQPGNGYHLSEPYPDLQVAVSVLSTGPVAPSDGIGYSNASRINRCCNADGLILKPSKPALAINDQIYQTALGNSYNGVDGEVWTTHSDINGTWFGIIFVPEIIGSYNMTPSTAGWGQFDKDMWVYEARSPDGMRGFAEDQPLALFNCVPSAPCVYIVTPVLVQSPLTVFLGELSKVVPVSPQRVRSIDVTGSDVTVHVTGAPSETAVFTFYVHHRLVTVSCHFRSTSAVLDLSAKTCQ